MKLILVLVFFIIVVSDVYAYRASVSQHVSKDVPSIVTRGMSSTVNDVLNVNLKDYVDDITTASDGGAQIIVFPEWGLWPPKYLESRETMAPFCSDREELDKYIETSRPPCDDLQTATQPTLPKLSCAAQKHEIDVVVNTCDRDENGRLRNINIAITKDGVIQKRYVKSHVFKKSVFDQPDKPDHVVFDSSFGVRFGMFVCFDIMFSDPGPWLHKHEGINHFVYSSEIPWIGRAAFKTWSWIHGSALLASNYGDDTSGIYQHGTTLASQSGDVLIADVEE